MNIFSVSNSGSQMGIIYVYCQSGQIVGVYSEDFTHEMYYEQGSGSPCTINYNNQNSHVQFSALQNYPDPSKHSNSILVSGNRINIRDSVGYAFLSNGYNYTVTVFSTVDCSTCPSNDGGWYELQLIISNLTNC